MDRRRFITIAGGGGVGILLPYALYRYLEAGMGLSRVGVKDYLNDGPQAALRAITPTGDFYLTSSRGEPSVDASKWSLRVDGLVEQPLQFRLDEVRRLPPYDTILTLECISNPVAGKYIGNASWRGTLLKPLLEKARLKPGAVYAVLHGADGYTTGHPVQQLLADKNFLAYEMNGEPLNRLHGFPLRIFIPGKYGMKLPKWLTRIEFVNREFLGYWETQGWSNVCDRQTQSVIDDPHDRAHISGKNFVITGYAIADAAGISRVEISTDGGRAWQEAPIFSNPNPSQVWAFWKYVWVDPPKGKHTIKVRATDGRGRLQTAARSAEWPDGATGYHSIRVEVG